MMAAMRSRTTPRRLSNSNERAKRASLRQRQKSQSSLSKPLWILVGPVEVVARFVPFELAVPRGLRGSCQECISFRGSERFKRDRKSTRLNSSHEWISYAVFCLKKKKEKIRYSILMDK